MGAILRPQQIHLLEELDRAIKSGCRRIMVQAPTGFGKTLVAASIANNELRAGRRAIFTVPALSLIDQTVERFYAQGVRDVGVIQADHHLTNYARPIQVASVQTLQRRHIPEVDMVVVDEAHRWFEFYSTWMKNPECSNVPFVGLSATPWTRGLGKYFDKLIIAATTRELIDAGYLSKFRVFAPASPDLSKVRTVAGDYHDGDLAKAMDKSALVADVVDTWITRGKGRPTLCFGVDRAHAKHLQQKFISSGVTAEYIDAYTDAIERAAIAKRFHAGEVEIVCNVGCLTTGIDWDVRCIILARPTKSEMLFVQMIGRGLRTADGKDDCLVLDHSDNHLRLGFVTDIHHEKLDDGRERQKAEPKSFEALPKKCPKCTYLKPPKMLICPACGFKPEPKCKVANKDGELVEFAARGARTATKSADRIGFYRELKYFANARGYKSGWVAHKYKERFGDWPKGLDHWSPLPPSPATLGWIRSRQIAFAKATSGPSSWQTPLQERARGRWHGILPAIGISDKFLKRKNDPCPMCGGKDRWRFTDIDGKGTWFCNNCRGGNGVSLVMKFTGLPFQEAALRIERVIGEAPAEPIPTERSDASKRAALNALWQSGRPIQADDPVDRWLQARGVGMQNYPKCLRAGMRIRHSGPPVSYHPAMLAMVTDASGKPVQIHRTYLTVDGIKAPVATTRMFCPGSLPASWAVRLAPAEPVLGVAEGIETSLAAMKMFGIPTWSALNADGVEKFVPPVDTKRLIIFGDNDKNGRGQRAAYTLAARMSGQVEVEIRIPEKSDTDWNDALLERGLG